MKTNKPSRLSAIFFKRVWRHWIAAPASLQRTFSAQTLQAITDAIAASELTHAGEIRFAIEMALPNHALWREQSARERSIEVFSNLRVWDTEQNNGVLIYLLLADRDVEIVADRGVHARVGAAEWERICQQMERAFAVGKFESGVIAGIAAIGAHLHAHFPPQQGDKNELPDRPVLL